VISRVSSWRKGGPEGREALPPAGSVDHTATVGTQSQTFWGKVTSRPAPTRADIEYAAWKLGVNYATAKRALEEGLI
jgi:hypothetical protein